LDYVLLDGLIVDEYRLLGFVVDQNDLSVRVNGEDEFVVGRSLSVNKFLAATGYNASS